MAAVGHFWFELRPDADAAAFERLMSGLEAEHVLQLTRVTSAFDARLLEVVREEDAETSGARAAEYLWEVTVHLVSGGHRYDFAENAERIQQAVGELATLMSVSALRPVQPVD